MSGASCACRTTHLGEARPRPTRRCPASASSRQGPRGAAGVSHGYGSRRPRAGPGSSGPRAKGRSAARTGDRAMTIPPSPRHRRERGGSRPEPDGPARLSDEQLTGCVMSPLARCASGAIDPDEWFPVAKTATAARAEAAHALDLCAVCPLRAECLELSLRHLRTTGRYGIWGGLVEAERASARGEWVADAEVTTLLRSAARDPDDPPDHSYPGLPGLRRPGHSGRR